MTPVNNKVSVIIVNWNGEQFIERCLTALTEQTLMPYEIILLDNASTDGSLAIARRFPSARIIALDYNAGFARGNNLAIALASAESEWIALINPDAYAEPRWLEALLFAASTNGGFDFFGSKLVNAGNPLLLDGVGDAYHISGLAWRTGQGCTLSEFDDVNREIFSPCAASALYRADSLRAVAGFDETYFCYMEDVDLGFRLRLAGYRCLYVPSSVAYHVGSGTTGGQDSEFSMYHGHRNLVWTFFKNMPGLLFWLLLPLHMALNVSSLIWFTFIRHRGGVIWRAKRDALIGLPSIWRQRRVIHKGRVASIRDVWQQFDRRLSITKLGRGKD